MEVETEAVAPRLLIIVDETRRGLDLYIGQGESEFLLGVPSGAMQVDLVVSHEGIEQQISLLDGEMHSGYSGLFYRSNSLATTVEALIAQPANLSHTSRRNDGSNNSC